MSGEETLWCAVLLQAFQDMASHTRNTKLIKEKINATFWLTRPSRDLFLVCEFSGYHPDTVMKRAQRVAMENGLNWRRKAGEGKQFNAKRREYKRQLRLLQKETRGLPECSARAYHVQIPVDA